MRERETTRWREEGCADSEETWGERDREGERYQERFTRGFFWGGGERNKRENETTYWWQKHQLCPENVDDNTAAKESQLRLGLMKERKGHAISEGGDVVNGFEPINSESNPSLNVTKNNRQQTMSHDTYHMI